MSNNVDKLISGRHYIFHFSLSFKELPLDTILNAITSSSSTSPTTIEENDTFHDNSINQTITISDLIEALNIVKNNNTNSATISCPPNNGTPNYNEIDSDIYNQPFL